MKTTDLAHYLSAFWHFDPPAVRRTVLLNLGAALSEGMGLMLLIPLLALAGAAGSQGDVPAWASWLRSGLDHWGVADKLPILLALFVFLVGLQAGLVLLRDRLAQSLQLRFVDHLRTKLFTAMAGSRWNYLCQRHSSDFLNVLTTDVQRVGAGTYFLLQLCTVAILSAVYLLVALHLSWRVTCLALLAGLGLWFLLRRTKELSKASGIVLSGANQGMFTQIQEFLAALKLVKIHAGEAVCVDQFQGAVEQLRARQLDFIRIQTRMRLTYRLGGALALALLAYFALAVARLPTASLLVLIAVFARLLPQVAQVQSGMAQLWHMLPAYSGWRSLLAQCESHCESPAGDGGTPALKQALALRGVVYRHPASHHELQAESLLIPANRTTAIIGPSGSGKTTLLDVICGLNPPQAGQVLVDGKPLQPSAGWRRSIAYIPQETVILDGTLRDNLAWGNAGPAEADLCAALEQAAAAEFVRRLPLGLDTVVGERGVRLSGGERQRLALARALLRCPQLLILDEATSAVDVDSQRQIMMAIKALHGRLTVLVVTHRHEELVGIIDGRITVDRGRVSGWEALAKEEYETKPCHAIE